MGITPVSFCGECPFFTDCCEPYCGCSPELEFDADFDTNNNVHEKCPLLIDDETVIYENRPKPEKVSIIESCCLAGAMPDSFEEGKE